MNGFRGLVLALCGSCVFVLGGAAALRGKENDRVYDASGRPAAGEIVEINEVEVTILVNTVQRKIPVNEIKRVVFGDEPSELTNARTAAYAGNFDTALKTLDKIDLTEIKGKDVLGDIDYYRAYAAAQMALRGEVSGDPNAAKDAARKMLTDYIRTHGGSKRHHFFEIAQVMGDLSLSQAQYEAAVKAYSILGQAPWPEYKLRSSVLVAQSLQGQEKFAEALAKYEEVLSKTASTPETAKQQMFAKLGRAVCIAGAGKPEEGLKIANEVIERADPAKEPLLFARAYNAQGACYQKANKPKDAIQSYLHTQLLFPVDPETHAESLYNLFILFRADRRSGYALRAKDELLQRYGGSVWATKAKAAK